MGGFECHQVVSRVINHESNTLKMKKQRQLRKKGKQLTFLNSIDFVNLKSLYNQSCWLSSQEGCKSVGSSKGWSAA